MLTTYITAILWSLFHVSTGHLWIEPSPVLDPNPQSCPGLQRYPYPDYIVHPQCISNSGGIFSKVPSVVIFTDTILQAIYKSSLLRQVFDLSDSTPLEYSQFVYKYNLDYYTGLGFSNAVAIAEFAARAIGKYFDVLTMQVVARVICSTAADYLLIEGILNTDNAKNLALAYAETIKNYAQAEMTADPTSKFVVLANSFFEFMLEQDENARETIAASTYCYGIEWFLSAVKNNCIFR